MKWLLRIVAALVGFVAILAAVGYFLPVYHVASRSAELNAPPEKVFALVSDLNNYGAWWPEGTETRVAVVESVPPSRFVTKIDEPDAPFGGTWTMEIVPTPAGSRLTITERGEIYNPIFRTLARFVFGYESTMEGCLAAARRRLAQQY
jgi:uncharacterized protein YndB with AHSA1/START domain